jgi:hypothetical protein
MGGNERYGEKSGMIERKSFNYNCYEEWTVRP